MNGRSYLVAGGSSGLGAACVRRLAAAGGHGVIADLKPPDEQLLVDVRRHFAFYPDDVTDENSVREAIRMAEDRFGPLRGVVICAGVVHAERIAGRSGPSDLGAFRRVVEINLVGTFNVLRLAGSAMQANEPDEEGQRGVIDLGSG